MSANANELSRLISLTFDESPEVRKQAAKSLGQIDDPAAIFALMELGYDKDPSVRDASIKVLETRKQSEAEVMSFAEIFREKKPVPDGQPVPSESAANEAKEKVLQPITRLFEKHWGKEKADAVKSKMMPTIEKIYLKNKSQSHETRTPAEVIVDSNENGRKVMQEFLTNYLEVISDLEHVGSELSSQVKPIVHDSQKLLEEEDLVPTKKVTTPVLEETLPPRSISQQSGFMEVDEMVDMRNEKGVSELPGTFFRKAYELMMLSGGDETVMKREMESMIEDANREIGLAFKLAKRKFKEAKITNLTRIKDGMRNVNTDLLSVKAIELKNSQGEKKLPEKFYRLTVNDSGGNEGVIYLFDEKAQMMRPGMRVKLDSCSAKTFGASGETVLITGKKGNLYIVL